MRKNSLRNSPANTKISEGQKAGHAVGAGAEVPLQSVGWTMTMQAFAVACEENLLEQILTLQHMKVPTTPQQMDRS